MRAGTVKGSAEVPATRRHRVQVDASGNVGLANNWMQVPVQTDPSGDGLVAYIGMAAPVKTPLIELPQQP